MDNTENAEKVEAGPAMPRGFLKAFTRLNVWVYRASGGRLMNKLAGDPICLVTMTGARSGRVRTIPLMYVPYRDGVLLVASQGGAPSHPVWYHNLVAHPDIIVVQGGRTRNLSARVLSGAERADAWPVCVEHYAPYADYQERTNREIPVFYCGPKQA
jgi:deazaflavin-dependent oxidoreductase (nitroreductase family)